MTVCAVAFQGEHSETEEKLSLQASSNTVAAVIGAALALVAIATALIIAAIYPALNGHAIVAATGTGIVAIALAAFTVTRALRRLRLPSNNDAWIFW